MQRLSASVRSLRDRLNLQRVLLAGVVDDRLVHILRAHGLQPDTVTAPPSGACALTTAAIVAAAPRSSTESCWLSSGLPTLFFHESADCSASDVPETSPLPEGCLRFEGHSASHVVASLLGHERALELGCIGFGPHSIQPIHIFAQSKHSFAIVNIKPVLPGHVLVVSRRRVGRFASLTPAEVADLWCLAQTVSAAVSTCHPGSTSATFAIQDGPAAGQTVPHVHIHVIPRKPADLPVNDAIYDLVEAHEKELASAVLLESPDLAVAPAGIAAPAGGAGREAVVAAGKPVVARTAIAVDPPTPPASGTVAGAGATAGPAAQQRPTAMRSAEEMRVEADRYRSAMAAAGFVDFLFE